MSRPRWTGTLHGWMRDDALILEVGARLLLNGDEVKAGTEHAEYAVPHAGWYAGVDRGAADGDGLDKHHDDLGEGLWIAGMSGEAAMRLADERWPFRADLAAKLPPKQPLRLRA